MNGIGNEELVAAIREIQDRVRARHPEGAVPGTGVPLANLLPLLHARDAAEAKVAAIGTVNPRRGGVANSVIQSIKRLVARALDWHVREQVEFNRAVLTAVQATLDALNETNQALAQLGGYTHTQMEGLREFVAGEMGRAGEEAREVNDIRRHWAEWRAGWEEKMNRSEVYLLRSISELSTSYQHRLTQSEAEYRQSARDQHAGFEAALHRAGTEIQQKLWADLARTRAEIEQAIAARQADMDRVIDSELRVIRQRGLIAPGAPGADRPTAAAAPAANTIDWLKFADRFRGSEQAIRLKQKPYIERFLGSTAGGAVLDIGCGRGEFLEESKAAGVNARGIDLSSELVELCRGKGLNASVADAFDYLRAIEASSLGGIYCSQVIEHIEPLRLPQLIELAAAKLRHGAWMIFESPNPECLAIFATHFYLDPTHTRPVPPALMHYYLSEAGMGSIEVLKLEPAESAIPAIKQLPSELHEALFGGLDYAIFAQKL